MNTRFGFEPVHLIKNEKITIALIGFCPADADEWGDDTLLYFPAHHKAFDVKNEIVFTPEEVNAIAEVYKDLL